MNPSDGSAGVVSTFAIDAAPVCSSISVASVNVPPMSIATLTALAHARSASVRSSVDASVARRRPGRPPRAARGGHLALEHVAQDALGLTLGGRPVAAAAAGPDR